MSEIANIQRRNSGSSWKTRNNKYKTRTGGERRKKKNAQM